MCTLSEQSAVLGTELVQACGSHIATMVATGQAWGKPLGTGPGWQALGVLTGPSFNDYHNGAYHKKELRHDHGITSTLRKGMPSFHEVPPPPVNQA